MKIKIKVSQICERTDNGPGYSRLNMLHPTENQMPALWRADIGGKNYLKDLGRGCWFTGRIGKIVQGNFPTAPEPGLAYRGPGPHPTGQSSCITQEFGWVILEFPNKCWEVRIGGVVGYHETRELAGKAAERLTAEFHKQAQVSLVADENPPEETLLVPA